MPEEKFSAVEKAAMKARSQELKSKTKVDPETQVLNAIEEMAPSDMKIAKKIHALVLKYAPGLKPKTRYGMPAYASK